MDSYLVGGAVRDKLLGIPVVDRDWVVVGGTPQQMLDAGYKSVGKDFPVFLHPDTHEEYALARTERKSAPGYHGFDIHTDESVTLEEDLLRRDLTINAIAETSDGVFVDPFNGQQDIKNRVLRHVSDAFIEDPVRVLRVARFMARLAPMGFTVAPETLHLMQAMAANGEIDTLVAERVWQELHAAMVAKKPSAFIETLRKSNALTVILPEVDKLFGVPQPAKWHPEIDSGIHTLMVLDQATALSADPQIRFAALCHDLGKGTTPAEEWPSHRGHEKRSAELIMVLCERLKTPKQFTDIAVLVGRYHLHCHNAFELSAKKVVQLLKTFDISRRPERFQQFLIACEADARGRKGLENRDYPQFAYLQGAATAMLAVDNGAIAKAATSPAHIPDDLHRANLNAIRLYIESAQADR
ncbi:MAG: multifunctional CCA addition/repair protein [Granulosicoccaceae bacterium]